MRVVRCGEGSVVVEAGGTLVLTVELLGAIGAMGGGGSHHHHRRHNRHPGHSASAAAVDGEHAPAPPAGPQPQQEEEEGLRSLCRLAALRLLEQGGQGGAEATNAGGGGILASVVALVAHRRYMDGLLPALVRVAGRSRSRRQRQQQQGQQEQEQKQQRVIEAIRWVEYPIAAPRSRLVLQGAGGAFAVDVLVEGAAPTLVWTEAGGASRRVTELGRAADVEACLEKLVVG